MGGACAWKVFGEYTLEVQPQPLFVADLYITATRLANPLEHVVQLQKDIGSSYLANNVTLILTVALDLMLMLHQTHLYTHTPCFLRGPLPGQSLGTQD